MFKKFLDMIYVGVAGSINGWDCVKTLSGTENRTSYMEKIYIFATKVWLLDEFSHNLGY